MRPRRRGGQARRQDAAPILQPVSGKRLSGGLFGAVTDQKTDKAVLVEGHLAKAIAAAALFPDRNVYGFGSRAWLGRAVPPEAEVLVIEDRAPEESGDDE